MSLLRRARWWAQARTCARIIHRRYGGEVYYIARDRARSARKGRVWFWTRVAIELARLEGREIGAGTGDRWR